MTTDQKDVREAILSQIADKWPEDKTFGQFIQGVTDGSYVSHFSDDQLLRMLQEFEVRPYAAVGA